jgi:hypothetical protein
MRPMLKKSWVSDTKLVDLGGGGCSGSEHCLGYGYKRLVPFASRRICSWPANPVPLFQLLQN